jgi:predicted DNA-binding transcriptional regulator AlpA
MTPRPSLATLPSRPVPRLALRADEAAIALGIGLSTFLELVKEGQMPKPITVPNHPGLVRYDAKAVEEAWRTIVEGSAPDNHTGWDKPWAAR